MCGKTQAIDELARWCKDAPMFLKAHERHKDGKRHVYYSLTESMRISRKRVVQRTVLHLGELNTTQIERWQRTIEAVQEDGQRRQMRLFTDREGQVPVAAEDVAEVILSSLVVRLQAVGRTGAASVLGRGVGRTAGGGALGEGGGVAGGQSAV